MTAAKLLSEARKALVAVAGLAGQAVALGLLNGTGLHVAQLVLAAATALGVYGIGNKPKG